MNDILTAIVESRTVDARLSVEGADLVLTMHHDLPCSPEQAFALLTQPDLTAGWSPVVTDRALDSVGPASTRADELAESVDSEVLEVAAPHLVRHRWGGDVLEWRVSAHGSGSRVVLRDVLEDPTTASSQAAGWHLCLAGLEARAAGHDVGRPVGEHAAHRYGWEQLRDSYDVLFAQQV